MTSGLPLPPSPTRHLVTKADLASWSAMAVFLLLVLKLHLLPALLGGLAVYELIGLLSRWLHFTTLSSERTRSIAVAVLAVAIVGLLAAAGISMTAYFRHGTDTFPALMRKLADIVQSFRSKFPPSVTAGLPVDAEALRQAMANLLRTHAEGLSIAGRDITVVIVRLLTGVVIGALLALRQAKPHHQKGPVAAVGGQTAQRLVDAFRRVVFAQTRIALVNTSLTALYLLLVLPLLGIQLPMAKTIVILTFVVDLIPIIGNLISNAVIVVLSLTASLWVAAGSLAFLVFIHEMEYFLSAHIVGSRIRARAWELLLAMLAMEAAFGFSGLIAAPIYYAYCKGELIDRELI